MTSRHGENGDPLRRVVLVVVLRTCDFGPFILSAVTRTSGRSTVKEQVELTDGLNDRRGGALLSFF